MKKISILIIFFLIFLPIQQLKSEIIVMSMCDDKQDEFLKNEYVLNLDELIMTRSYVYKEKTFKKYKKTDLSICKTDPSTGYCYGCGRTNNEKRIWKIEDTTDEWKEENLKIIKKRLTGWQLKSFEESYTYKIENGISLFKKNLKNE